MHGYSTWWRGRELHGYSTWWRGRGYTWVPNVVKKQGVAWVLNGDARGEAGGCFCRKRKWGAGEGGGDRRVGGRGGKEDQWGPHGPAAPLCPSPLVRRGLVLLSRLCPRRDGCSSGLASPCSSSSSCPLLLRLLLILHSYASLLHLHPSKAYTISHSCISCTHCFTCTIQGIYNLALIHDILLLRSMISLHSSVKCIIKP